MKKSIPHESFMQRCLQLASLGLGNVSPNPQVGSVLVFEDRILGEGFHQKYGEAHAEVNCIKAVSDADKDLIEKATLYVNLEPCSHHGKTPPCVDFILQNKIKKVIIGCKDVSAKVNGKGIAKLRDYGVEVIEPVLEKECIEINKRFFYFELQKIPYVILKWAESADGFIGQTNKRIKISNSFSDRVVHQWRADEDAIMVGYHTALQDNPRLNVRFAKGNNPLRIVYDKDVSLPDSLHLFDQSQATLVFNEKESKSKHLIEYVSISPDRAVEQMLDFLGKKKMMSVIIEGGSRLIQKFIDTNLWNEARVIRSNQYLLDGISKPVLSNAKPTAEMKVKNDTLTFFTNTTHRL